jgi:hypothetical protein
MPEPLAYRGDGRCALAGRGAGGVHAVCATVSGMRNRYLFLLIVAGCLPGVFVPAWGAASGSAESRVAAQDALFEELDLLDSRTNSWIQAQQQGAK